MVNNKQTIAIADSSYILRKGLIQVINQIPTVARVVELDENESLYEQIEDYNPDIVIINPLLLGITSGNNPRQQLRLEKHIHLVAVTQLLIESQYLQYYDTAISINDTANAIIEKLKNLSIAKKNASAESEELSEREKEILVTLVKGMSNKEIADHHNISIHTVITHRRNITRKLDIHSPSGLTVYAIVNKLVDLNDIRL